MFSLAAALAPSGLLAECTDGPTPDTPSSYYGYNVTKSEREPLDQIHGFIAASRILRYSETLSRLAPPTFYPFIAGRFEVLNTTSEAQLVELDLLNFAKEQRKRDLFLRIARGFKLPTTVLLTADLLEEEEYWSIVADLMQGGQFSRKTLIADTLKWYKSESEIEEYLPIEVVGAGRFALTSKLLKRVGSWPAPLLYTPMEVAEAVFMRRRYGVRCKIGHMEENVYDRYIVHHMDIVHLRQPTDLKSTRTRPRTVTPYIDKVRRDPKLRVFFDDTDASLRETLSEANADLSYVRTISTAAGEILNPILDKAVLAVECASAQGGSVLIDGYEFESGAALIQAVSDGWLNLEHVMASLADAILEWMILPFENKVADSPA